MDISLIALALGYQSLLPRWPAAEHLRLKMNNPSTNRELQHQKYVINREFLLLRVQPSRYFVKALYVRTRSYYVPIRSA